MLCTIAGLDPTHGAGIDADGRTFEAHGCLWTAIVTAETEQDERGVQAVRPADRARLLAAIRAVLGGATPPAAIKTGLLPTAEVMEVVGGALGEGPARPLVVDPVIWAGVGGRLMEERGIEALATHLAPHAQLVTPNLPEAARLLGRDPARPPPAAAAAQALLGHGWRAVLVKGGHEPQGATVVDVLATPQGLRRYVRPRVDVGPVRGTGCTLAAAIACHLAAGASLAQAVSAAGDWLNAVLQATAQTGTGHLDPHACDPASFTGSLPPLTAGE